MTIFDDDVRPMSEEEALQAHIDQVLAQEEPAGTALEVMYRAIKALFNPLILNRENIPDGPCLFVGNHSLFALDGYILGPLFVHDMQRFVRALGDRFLFANPKLASVFIGFGCALGDPRVCSALMEDGQDVLVFPGGAYEAVKPATALYQLQWRQRYGFVRLAAQHGYTIMPFATVGPDELYGHLLEGEDLPDSPVGLLLKRMGVLNEHTRRDLLPPIPVGALGTLLPKPQRFYMSFGEPIDLSRYKGRTPTKKQQEKIRDEVAQAIEDEVADLLVTRARNRGNESLLRRLLTI